MTDLKNSNAGPKPEPGKTSSCTIEDLGRLWDEGVSSGPSRDGEEAFARLRSRLKSREHPDR